jgi:hypothetical protein
MMARMKLSRSLHQFENRVKRTAGFGNHDLRLVVRNVGWVSAGVTVLAIGVVVGRELRQRYKFQRRTPYDFYAHSGDQSGMEFGVGI